MNLGSLMQRHLQQDPIVVEPNIIYNESERENTIEEGELSAVDYDKNDQLMEEEIKEDEQYPRILQ